MDKLGEKKREGEVTLTPAALLPRSMITGPSAALLMQAFHPPHTRPSTGLSAAQTNTADCLVAPHLPSPLSGLLPQDKGIKLSSPEEGTEIQPDRMRVLGSQESLHQLRQRAAQMK